MHKWDYKKSETHGEIKMQLKTEFLKELVTIKMNQQGQYTHFKRVIRKQILSER